MQRVQVAGGFGTEEFVSRDVQPGKAFYLMAQLCRETESGAELLLPMLDHLPAQPVQRRINQHVGARGHEQVGARGQLIGIDKIALTVKHRALLESGAHLVHAIAARVRWSAPRP